MCLWCRNDRIVVESHVRIWAESCQASQTRFECYRVAVSTMDGDSGDIMDVEFLNERHPSI